jgi:hypothetical protein
MRTALLSPSLAVLLHVVLGAAACANTVSSGDGAVVARDPGGGFRCAPNDAQLPHFNQSGVKCRLSDDTELLVMGAKLYRVGMEDATTA